MKKLCLLIICFIIFYPSWSNASKNIDGAKKFINEFLEAEFNGIQDFRVDNTIYSKKRELIIKRDYEPMIGEIFLLGFCKTMCC